MIKLKQLLLELSFNSTLYHRSFREHKVGDIIDASNGGSYNKDNKDLFERILEQYRREKFPNVISRQECIFCSVVPRSRFVVKGTLYVVKPVGTKMLMTDSRLIDEMAGDFQRQLSSQDYYLRIASQQISDEDVKYFLDRFTADRYFKGTERANKEDLEVLCDKVQITEIINEDRPYFKYGNKVKVVSSFDAACTVYSIRTQQLADRLKQILSTKYFDSITEWKQRETNFGKKEIAIDMKGKVKVGAELYIGRGAPKMMDDPDTRTHYDNYKHSRYKYLELYADKPGVERKSIGLIRISPIGDRIEDKLQVI